MSNPEKIRVSRYRSTVECSTEHVAVTVDLWPESFPGVESDQPATWETRCAWPEAINDSRAESWGWRMAALAVDRMALANKWIFPEMSDQLRADLQKLLGIPGEAN